MTTRNPRKSLTQGSSSRNVPESSSGDSENEADSDFIPTPKRSRNSRAYAQAPKPASPTLSPPAQVIGNSKKRETVTREDGNTGFTETSISVKPPAKRSRMSRSTRASAAAAQLHKGILGLAVRPLQIHISLNQSPFPDMLRSAAIRSIKFVTRMHNISFVAPWSIFNPYLANCSHRERYPGLRFKTQYLRTEVC